MEHRKGFSNHIASLAVLTVGASLLLPAQGRAQGINVTVDGEVISFTGQPAMEQNGSVLVPLRGVFEKLGASVLYDNATKSILATKGATSVQLTIGQTAATVNGRPQTLAMPAMTVNGTTLVPLRFVSEALGADVRWSGASRTVIISTSGNGNNIPTEPGTAAPQVTSLRHNAQGTLRAGERITVTLVGTPDGEATFTIPGIPMATNRQMQQSEPGTYTGAFTIPKGVRVKEAVVQGHLTKGGKTSPMLQASQPLIIDGVGPALSDLSPAPGSVVSPGRPTISGTFSGVNSGIRIRRTRLILNGKDVTDAMTLSGSSFSFRPRQNLPMGNNTVLVVATDAAGNETRKSWEFTVSGSGSGGEALVEDLTFSPVGRRIEPGEVITVRLRARPGGTASYSIGSVITDRPLREQSPGIYVGSYTVKKGDAVSEALVSATFTLNGRTATRTADRPISFRQ